MHVILRICHRGRPRERTHLHLGCLCLEQAGAALKISLKNPVTIEAGKTYYIGVYCTATSANDCQVVVDNKLHEGIEGGWVATRPDKNSPWTWDNLSDAYGYVCVSATITGENLPRTWSRPQTSRCPCAYAPRTHSRSDSSMRTRHRTK